MHQDDLKELLARSALYSLLGCCFSPIKNNREWQTIESLAKELPRQWQDSVQGLLAGGPPPPDVYLKLFGTAGVCHDCETDCLTDLPEGKGASTALADVAGFYRAFSFPTDSRRGNPLDHIATELEFLSFMFAKEARAAFQGDGVAREICLSAREKFVKEHLFKWIPQFTKSVTELATCKFYSQAATLLLKVIKEEVTS